MAIQNYIITLQATGPTSGGPPNWVVESDTTYTWSSGAGPYLFTAANGTLLGLTETAPDIYSIAVSDFYSVGWAAVPDISKVDLLGGMTTLDYLAGASSQVTVLTAATEPAPPPPAPTQAVMPRALSLSRMPNTLQGLSAYGESVAGLAAEPTITAAVAAFQVALAASTSPKTRSAVTIQTTYDAEAILKNVLRIGIAAVIAAEKKPVKIVLSKVAPSFTLKAGIGTLKFSNLKGKPTGVKDCWFEIQVKTNIADAGADAIEESITKTGVTIDVAALGGKVVHVRGRWVWRVNGQMIFGPYTIWTNLRLPFVQNEE